jgi:hypothetical protein
MWTKGDRMTPRWQTRQYEPISFARDVLHPHPKAGEIEIGDTIVLYVEGDDKREAPVYVHLTDIAPSGMMAGKIFRAGKGGPGGDQQLAEGAAAAFDGDNIFRIEKAT